MQHALLGLAENPSLPSELVDRLVAGADADLAEVLACRADLTPALVVALARFDPAAVRLVCDGRLTTDDIDPTARPRVALAMLEQGSGRPEWARLLATDPLEEHREKLAACVGLPDDVTRTLASAPEVRVAAELALWTTADVATDLSEHPHAEVRRALAANETAPPTVLAALLTGQGWPPARSCSVCDREETPFVHDPHCARPGCTLPPGAACSGAHESTVRQIEQMALRNPATPVAAVVDFVDHPSMLLRHELATRIDLPASVYARLARDSVPWIRATLADNPAIEESVIHTLAGDTGHEVQRRLAHHPGLPLEFLPHLAEATRIGSTLLPRIASATSAEVEELAASPNPTVRMLLAQRRDLPDAIRDTLARDPDAKVVKSIAPHPGLSEDQLRTTVARHGVRVIAKVAANPDATSALLESLADFRPPVRKALREIARHRNATSTALLVCLTDPDARPLAARHPALPPSVIAELLSDGDWQVVEAAAANPSLPYAAMSGLLH
ncbi:hypothetical protein [Nocardia sp. NBC_01329]|uniref:hypothetical protein n=1 Tax=Nocardia sp. NBC_01329 TaxID=2903594 RepID=UPI002E12BDD6|nr:hypothetical protein OG405_06855 [Nocardia sp. NBC_01329]